MGRETELYGDYFGNRILYAMCENENGEHTDPNIVAGKMWLIGRANSASPERTLGRKPEMSKEEEKELETNTDSDYFGFVSKIIAEQHTTLDEAIDNLRKAEYKYDGSDEDIETLALTIELVKTFNTLVIDASKEYKEKKYKKFWHRFNAGQEGTNNNISFASKYLHFHLPHLVYIMDKYSLKNGAEEAKNALSQDENQQLTELQNDFLNEVEKNDPFKPYIEHVCRCYLIAQKDNKNLSPRAVDDLLMKREPKKVESEDTGK